MNLDLDLELTDPSHQLVIISRPDDFMDADLEVATVGLDIIENSVEAALEYQMRILARKRSNPNSTHPKILLDGQAIDRDAMALVDKMLDARERIAGLKGRRAKQVRMA